MSLEGSEVYFVLLTAVVRPIRGGVTFGKHLQGYVSEFNAPKLLEHTTKYDKQLRLPLLPTTTIYKCRLQFLLNSARGT